MPTPTLSPKLRRAAVFSAAKTRSRGSDAIYATLGNVQSDGPSNLLQLEAIARLDVAAASGLVVRGERLCVLADDSFALHLYTLDGTPCGEFALLPGSLPDDPKLRKAHKPDFEALVDLPDGSLLALGSGSALHRARGVWIRFAETAMIAHEIDLGSLYAACRGELPELNIEAGACIGATLFLLSRGNGAARDNAVLTLDADALLVQLAQGALSATTLRGVQRIELGELHGTALSFTDACVLRDRLLFCAAAEASPDTYQDGVCAGSVLGIMEQSGRIIATRPLTPLDKIEGLCLDPSRSGHALLVADADDPASRSPLYRCALPDGW